MDPPELHSGCDWSLSTDSRPLLLVVEGQHDVEFLRRLSANLSRDDPSLPDLGRWEREGRLVFVPIGGGDVLAWSERFSPLQCPELHVYDREIPPETAIRMQAAARVNARRHCQAVVTTKRSLENYLHPAALVLAGGVSVEFDDEASVADCVARQQFAALGFQPDWDQLSRRTQGRFTNRVKRWLNTVAVEYLSPQLLAERDPQGEVLNWLRTMARLMRERKFSDSTPTSQLICLSGDRNVTTPPSATTARTPSSPEHPVPGPGLAIHPAGSRLRPGCPVTGPHAAESGPRPIAAGSGRTGETPFPRPVRSEHSVSGTGSRLPRLDPCPAE